MSRLATSDNLLVSIQEKIKWADSMSELDKKHSKDVEDRVEEVKKSLSLKVSWIHFYIWNMIYEASDKLKQITWYSMQWSSVICVSFQKFSFESSKRHKAVLYDWNCYQLKWGYCEEIHIVVPQEKRKKKNDRHEDFGRLGQLMCQYRERERGFDG